jgi:hypothetical protein
LHYSNSTGQRLDALEADVSGLKTDVSGLKSDVSGLKSDVSGLKADVSGLKADVSGLKSGLNQVKIGGIVVFLLAVLLSSSQMKAMEKRQDAAEVKADAKAIAAEAKADAKAIAAEARMNNMFFFTSFISIAVPFLMSFYSKTS